VSIPGPTLLDLEDQVKATTFQMMVIFVSRSIGYLLGALLGGVLFDCFDKQLLMFCTLLLASVATVAIPWSLTMVVMATMFALQGVTMGALDTGKNT
jgi:FHS family Na+ dependent glucose MFS transporter 1